MISSREERSIIGRVNNKALHQLLSKSLEDELDNLKIADEKNFRIYQGRINILSDILKLIKV